ncbi:MAG: hypothetical protein SH857_10510 [Chitinophagales bacterium]|nr:hypothetical protein [Chitinophagales bacterium]
MKHIIEIDDKSVAGKRIVRHLKSVAQRNKAVTILTPSSLQAKEDAALAHLISEGLKSGIADKSRVLKKFGIKL